jgi:hypothetical protein
MPRGVVVHQAGDPRPPDYVLEARDARLSYEPSANMAILGDPPPGHSALDRLNCARNPPRRDRAADGPAR